VDDVSLTAILKKHRIRIGLSVGASVKTPLQEETFRSWIQWLTRQWFYLKVCFPGSWLAAGLYCLLFACTQVFALIAILGMIPGWTAGVTAFASLLFLCLFFALATILRGLQPAAVPLPLWLTAVFLTPFAAVWAHTLTLFTMKTTWWGIRYHVGWMGIVKRPVHEQEQGAATGGRKAI
jgi:hypothetical protein